jgi:hypothetical protein
MLRVSKYSSTITYNGKYFYPMPKYATDAELTELRELVEVALANCNATNLPNVCAMNATEDGHKVVLEAVVRNCIQGQMGPSSALLELEREYGFTSLD